MTLYIRVYILDYMYIEIDAGVFPASTNARQGKHFRGPGEYMYMYCTLSMQPFFNKYCMQNKAVAYFTGITIKRPIVALHVLKTPPHNFNRATSRYTYTIGFNTCRGACNAYVATSCQTVILNFNIHHQMQAGLN